MGALFVTALAAEETEENETKAFVEALTENVTISGLIEVNAGFESYFDDTNTSDIWLETADLEIGFEPNEWVNGYVYICWYDDDENFDLDEAVVNFGNTDKFPVTVSAGKMYVPFGIFESNMVSDPLTQDFGETRNVAFKINGEYENVYGSIYTFNGEVDEVGEEDKIRCFGANIGYILETDKVEMDLGLDYINNIMESFGFQDNYEDMELEDYADALAAHAVVSSGPVQVIGEYIAAMDDIEFIDAVIDAPKAWNMEVGYNFKALNKDAKVGVSYQGTDNVAGWLPEKRYLGTAGVNLINNVDFAVEYRHDEDYSEDEGGSGEDCHAFTVQMALDF
jgi:hypothetical protein